MKIINPTFYSSDLAAVQFERLNAGPRDRDMFELTVAGSPVGELAPVDLPDGMTIGLDPRREVAVQATGCWSLDLIEDDRSTATHVLFVSSHCYDQTPTLTGELAVWATLLLIWSRSECVRNQG